MKKMMMLVLFTVCVGLLGCSNDTVELERTFTNEQWIEEIDHMANAVMNLHPKPFYAVEKETWLKSVEQLINDVPTLTEKHIQYRTMQLLAEIQDAHVTYSFADNSKLYPLYFNYFGDDLRVLGTLAEHEELIGAKLIEINDEPLENILPKIDSLISHENKQWAKVIRPGFMINHGMLEYLNITDKEDVTFTLINDDGKTFYFHTTPIDLNDYYNQLVLIEKPIVPLRSQIPETADLLHWFTYLPEEETLYFQYNSCVQTDYEPFKLLKNELLSFIREKNGDMKKLIIDFRMNTGGFPEAFTSLAGNLKLLQEEYPFDVYTLVGKPTASAATIAMSDAQKYLNATSIGEETGGQSKFFAGVFPQELPHSKAIFVVSRTYYDLGDNDGGLLPDIEIIETFEDYQQGIDRVLDMALSR